MSIDRADLVLAALIVEAVLGYPRALFAAIGHPVTWIGAVIARLDVAWNRGSAIRRRLWGIVLLLLLVSGAVVIGVAIASLAATLWGALAVVSIATTGLAQRSLDDHVRAVNVPLGSGDLPAARQAVGRIVGRDTAALDEAGIATAAIESLAESFCDGVVAPIFWFALAGIPGLIACKAINTADSMVGHRDARHRDFGWASARADDVVNFIPARIAGVLICIAGAGGLLTMLRDSAAHASPNGGWPEAAMAGVLRRQLGGPVSYAGEAAARAVLGAGPLPGVADLSRALWVYRRACLALWVVLGVIAWRL